MVTPVTGFRANVDKLDKAKEILNILQLQATIGRTSE
jgi:hypothetical protein